MAFGFGKKNKEGDAQSSGAGNNQQISPKALELLEQLAASGQQAVPMQQGQMPQMPAGQIPAQQVPVQADPMQQMAMQQMPAQPPNMPVSGMPLQNMQAPPVQAPPVQAPAMQQTGMQPADMSGMAPQMVPNGNPATVPFTAPTMPTGAIGPVDDGNGKSKGGKKANKPKISREEKRQAAKLVKEEKERNKRRKKLSKSRFSRARYLREANGNAVAGLSLWIFMIVVFVAGPFILNSQFLLPKTRENNDIVNQIEQLKNAIERSKPQIEIAVRNKTTTENEIKTRAASFPPSQTVSDAFTRFIDELKANDMIFDDNVPAIVVPQNIGVTGLIGQSVNLQMRGDFLTYLRIRNNFVNAQRSVRISKESIQAQPGDPTMSINVTITIPSKNS
jgi:hypothetical protein